MKNKKKKINEGMILVSPMVPVIRIDSLTGRKKDNFEFKGLPEQFNEEGEKILDENGNKIEEKIDKEFTAASLAGIIKKTKKIPIGLEVVVEVNGKEYVVEGASETGKKLVLTAK